MEDGFASSPANIERDHGVGYDRRSISSIAERSRSWSGRISLIPAPAPAKPAPALLGRLRQAYGSCCRLLHIGEAQVDRLDELGRPGVARQLGVEASPRNVPLVDVRRYDASGRLDPP